LPTIFTDQQVEHGFK